MYDVSVVNFIPPRLPKWPLFSSDWAVASHFLQVGACFETFGLCRIGGALDRCLKLLWCCFSCPPPFILHYGFNGALVLDPGLLGTGFSFSLSSAFRLRCPFVLATGNSAVVVLPLVAADNEVFIASRFAFVKVVTAGAVTLAGFAAALVERVFCKVST